MRRLLAAAGVLMLAAALGAATARAAAPVNAALTLDRASITVGDRILMSIVVDAEPGHAVSDPTLARAVGPFEVVQTQATVKSTRGQLVRYTYRYVITAWTVGDLVLPAIDVPWAGPNGAGGTARTAETAVHVSSVIARGEDASDIKPLKPQLGLHESILTRVARVGVVLAGIALATVALGAVLWLILRRRGATAPEERLSPAQRAMRELATLAERRMPEQGRTAEHYEELTATLRRYVVAQYGVQPGRTSREVRDALERAGLERTQAAALYELLREGDEVRFRGATPYPAHAQNAVRAAIEIVRRAASAEEYEIAALQPQ